MKAIRNIIYPAIAVFAFACFALSPGARAVSPPPGGGYPGGNTAEGASALLSLTSGTYNTALGLFSLEALADGKFNTSLGAGALLFNAADENTATGAGALLNNAGAADNTATGAFALFSNTDSGDNTATGADALFYNTGGGNTAVGYRALFSNTTGLFNTALGFFAGVGVTTATNVICIGADGTNVNDSCFIGNIYANVQPVVGTDPDYVTIASVGRLGRGNVSSRRYKHDIQPMDKASEVLYALRPVSFRYVKEYDLTQTIAFGLIAEDVAGVAPDLVGRNSKGEPESVRYEQINAMMLNEFLKEHKRVEEHQSKIAKQEATIADLKSTVAQQQAGFQSKLAEQEKHIGALASGLQKIDAQFELGKPEQQVVSKNHKRQVCATP